MVYLAKKPTVTILMSSIDISHDYCLPKQFRFFGVAVVVFAIVFVAGHLSLPGKTISLVSVIAGLLMLTARYGLLLNAKERRYKEYVHLLSYKKGQWLSYAGIEKIFVNKLKISEIVVSRTGARFDAKSQIFQAYLKLDDGTKVELDSDSNRERLVARLNRYNRVLQTTIQDNTV